MKTDMFTDAVRILPTSRFATTPAGAASPGVAGWTTRLGNIGALAAAIALALAAIGLVAVLNTRASESRDAEVALGDTLTKLYAMQELPWEASPPPSGSGLAIVTKRIDRAEPLIREAFEALPQGIADEQVDAALAHWAASMASMREIARLVAAERWEAADETDRVGERELVSLTAALEAAGGRFRTHAADSLRRAQLGSAAAVLVLVAAFGFFYGRSVRRGARIRAALTSLELSEADRTRLFAQTVRASENERVRLAADLHDGAVQHLGALGYVLDRSAQRLRRAEAKPALADLEHVREELTSEIGELRHLVAELRPPALDQGGLEAALRDLAADFGRRQKLSVVVDIDLAPVALAPESEIILYRVAQECLANVARHAAAERVHIVAHAGADEVTLAIDDDGVGFDLAIVSDLVRREHFGLIGMRERVESIGGEWSVRSTNGLGTCLTAKVPASPQPAALEPTELALAS